MDEERKEYTVYCRGKSLCEVSDLDTAIERAYEASEARPNEPVEVKGRGDSRPIFWRMAS
jgi:hypothetical protein